MADDIFFVYAYLQHSKANIWLYNFKEEESFSQSGSVTTHWFLLVTVEKILFRLQEFARVQGFGDSIETESMKEG
jgi:hypothetical protein